MYTIFAILAILAYSLTLTLIAFIAILLTIMQLLKFLHACYLEEQRKNTEKEQDSQPYVTGTWGTADEEIVEAEEVVEDGWPEAPDTADELRWGMVSDETAAKLDLAYDKAKKLGLPNPANLDSNDIYGWYRRRDLIFRMTNNIEPLF